MLCACFTLCCLTKKDISQSRHTCVMGQMKPRGMSELGSSSTSSGITSGLGHVPTVFTWRRGSRSAWSQKQAAATTRDVAMKQRKRLQRAVLTAAIY
jgi:hypothetical protein